MSADREVSGINCQLGLTELTAYFGACGRSKEQSNMWTCSHLVNESVDSIHKLVVLCILPTLCV